ncbi:MAG: hypothetical protein E6G94_16745 [Alphaproteobacteria bacterium]|nr:MAG: hypothetical protein E6G94_16745 [Alphaproteobacteria bacterium]
MADPLDTFHDEIPPIIFTGMIAEDAETANSEVHVKIPRSDGSGVLLPSRGDWCLVGFDQDDNAQLINWRTDDPTA